MALPALRTCALFAGGAGLELGIELAVPGSRAVVYVEREAYAAAALVARMEEATLAPAPVWDDVATFDGRPWRGLVDCVAGGFPCQDISNAGKREGIEGDRSGLWTHFARVIREMEPWLVWVENVAALTVRGLDVVLGDLAEMGFDAEWGVVGADDAGAPHQRDRLFILAHAGCIGKQRIQSEPEPRRSGASTSGGDGEAMADSAQLGEREPDHETRPDSRHDARADAGGRGGNVGDSASLLQRDEPTSEGSLQQPDRCDAKVGDADCRTRARLHEREQSGYMAPLPRATGSRCAPFPPGPDDQEGWSRYLQDWPSLEPAVRRGADGLAYRMERLRLLGNGVVPQQAALAWWLLARRLGVDPGP